jgi:hypothetical protein
MLVGHLWGIEAQHLAGGLELGNIWVIQEMQGGKDGKVQDMAWH